MQMQWLIKSCLMMLSNFGLLPDIAWKANQKTAAVMLCSIAFLLTFYLLSESCLSAFATSTLLHSDLCILVTTHSNELLLVSAITVRSNSLHSINAPGMLTA